MSPSGHNKNGGKLQMAIGEKLKQARIKRNLDLEDVARATKIGKLFLIAIENEEFSQLPGGVYNRNFIRAYAHFLKLDEDIITSEYHVQHEVKPQFVVHKEQTKKDDFLFRKERRRNVLIAFLALAAAVALVIFWGLPKMQSLWQPMAAHGLSDLVPSDGDSADDASSPVGASSGTGTERSASAPDGVGADGLAKEAPSAGQDAQAVGGPGRGSGGAAMSGEPGKPPQTGVFSEEPDAEELASGSIAEALGPQKPLPHGDLSNVEIINRDLGLGVFAIEALGDVRVQVTIDGEIITNRLLKKGQVRYYGYGRYNALLIEDGSLVALQDESTFLPRSSAEGESVFLPHFGPGKLFGVLAASDGKPTASGHDGELPREDGGMR